MGIANGSLPSHATARAPRLASKTEPRGAVKTEMDAIGRTRVDGRAANAAAPGVGFDSGLVA